MALFYINAKFMKCADKQDCELYIFSRIN